MQRFILILNIFNMLGGLLNVVYSKSRLIYRTNKLVYLKKKLKKKIIAQSFASNLLLKKFSK